MKNITIALLKLNSYEFTTVAALIGYLLSDGLNGSQTTSIGNFFELVGQVLETLGAQMQNLNEKNEGSYEECYNELKKKIGNIDEIIADLNNIYFKPH